MSLKEGVATRNSEPSVREPKRNIRKVDCACNLCGSFRSVLVTKGVEHEYTNTTVDEFVVVRCTQCGFVYMDPRPDLSELKTIYPPNYYSFNQERLRQQANPNSLLSKARYAGFKNKVRKSISLCKPHEGPFTVLDIGCGDGHLLNLYKNEFNDSVETHGADFSVQAVVLASAQGHKTYHGRFEEVRLPTEYFDLVVASHVIEHVPDPRAFTEKVFQILKPGGVFWFETPNIGTVDAKWFEKEHWGAYHFPRHWCFFSVATIKRLAELTNFQVDMIDFVPNAIFWFWTFHSMMVKDKPHMRPLADALFPPVDFQRDTLMNFLRICFFCGIDVVIKKATGQTSNMIVAFRKPE